MVKANLLVKDRSKSFANAYADAILKHLSEKNPSEEYYLFMRSPRKSYTIYQRRDILWDKKVGSVDQDFTPEDKVSYRKNGVHQQTFSLEAQMLQKDLEALVKKIQAKSVIMA